MSKKLITACMALVALAAFALPAAASASPVVTHPTGTVLNPETGECTGVKKTICIKATNIGNAKLLTDPAEGTATLPMTECSTVTMTGYLEKNTGGVIEATIHTATFEGTGGVISPGTMHECTGFNGLGNLTPTVNGGGTDGESISNGTPWCLKSGASDTFTIRGGACTAESRKITFVFDSTKSSHPTEFNQCKYERANAVEGTFTTDTTGDAILSVKPGSTTAERAKITFTGETGNSIECPARYTFEMSFTLETDTATAEPIYIS